MATGYPSARTWFLVSLAAATVGPLAVALIHVQSEGVVHHCAVRMFRVLNIVAAPHVVTTLYLLLDRRQLEGVPRPALTLGVAPLALMAACLGALLAAPLWVATSFMLGFVFYGTWHFGRQNLGIAMFSARVGGGPMDRSMRLMLNAGVLAGLLVTYRAFAPTLMLTPDLWPFDLSAVEPVLSRLWYLGIAVYVVLIPAVFLWAIRRRREYSVTTAIIQVGCVLFFLPAYLSDNALFLVASWTVAHGLQYLVMLCFHAVEASRADPGPTAFRPLLAFGLSLAAGVSLWLAADRSAHAADASTAKVLLAAIMGLTLAHYWIDQFLWRLRAPARRAWLSRSYSFLESTQHCKASHMPT